MPAHQVWNDTGRFDRPLQERDVARLSLILSLVMVFSSFALAASTAQSSRESSGLAITQEELTFVKLLNKERATRGLSQLTVDSMLIEVARAHSREMAEKNYFAHNSPTPGMKTALDRYLAAVKQRPSWALVGENLFYCSIVDVTRGHVALMNSEGHRANILEGRFDRVGIGAYTDSKGQFFVTQMFLAKTN